MFAGAGFDDVELVVSSAIDLRLVSPNDQRDITREIQKGRARRHPTRGSGGEVGDGPIPILKGERGRLAITK